MKNAIKLLTAVVVLSAVVVILGCSRNGSQPGSEQADNWKEGLDEDVVKALSQLSAEDRAAALKQKTCPVTDKQLGSMDEPPKVDIEGKDVFLCCGGCEEELRKDPDKYLAKLKAD